MEAPGHGLLQYGIKIVVTQYFLYCVSFPALREKLFACAGQLLGNRWHCASDNKQINRFLNGISHDDFDFNVIIVGYVQSFIFFSNSIC